MPRRCCISRARARSSCPTGCDSRRRRRATRKNPPAIRKLKRKTPTNQSSTKAVSKLKETVRPCACKTAGGDLWLTIAFMAGIAGGGDVATGGAGGRSFGLKKSFQGGNGVGAQCRTGRCGLGKEAKGNDGSRNHEHQRSRREYR